MTGDARVRPRVLAYTDADDVGGAETSLATLMAALSPQVDVVIAATDRRVGSFVQERCPDAEVRVLPRVASKTDLRAILQHVRLLREVRPDILHANLPHPWTGQYGIMAAAAFARGTRVVAVEHSSRPTASRAQGLLRRLVRRRIDVQVTVGSQSARDLERLRGRERALQHFSQQHMVEQFLALYRELGAGRGGRRRSLVRFTTLERVRWKLWLLYLQARGVPKTVVFNLRYLPLRQALRFPVSVSHRVVFRRLGGRVVIEGPVRRGMVRLGYGGIDFFDRKRSWAVWHVVDGGEVIFRGQALIGHGSSVESKGTLVLGDRVQVMAESRLLCHDRIEIGDGTLVSWEVMIMDTDHHAMLDERGERRPVTAPILIGPESWLGTRVTVLKGVTLGPGTVVAAGTTVHRSFPDGGTVVAGTGARAVRSGVRWEP